MRHCITFFLVRSNALLLLVIGMIVYGPFAEAKDPVWLLVETDLGTLSVMHGDHPVDVFKNIAIGQKGTTREKLRGDRKTPLGKYRIGWINSKSRFNRFFGFNYPSINDAKRGYYAGIITTTTFRALLRAAFNELRPRQNTPLGGQLGIHGLGKGNTKVHRKYNWTRGCVALTNQQVDRLSGWIEVGTLVEVR